MSRSSVTASIEPASELVQRPAAGITARPNRKRRARLARQEARIAAARREATAELATRVAHEVNNPLTGVLGYAELALAALPPDDPVRADVETIRAEALRARAIVQ